MNNAVARVVRDRQTHRHTVTQTHRQTHPGKYLTSLEHVRRGLLMPSEYIASHMSII